MTAKVVDVTRRKSPIIQGGLEIEVEVTVATNEENISVLKKEHERLYDHKFLASLQNVAIVGHEESSDDTLQDEFIRGVEFRENCHFMHIRGLIYSWLKTVTL